MPALNPSPNYLPVLLVSVNAAPDDNFVAPRPRGQVDYLSHEWQEEDVWRSWRNMTRQKKEIANGVRLENASWRTWWKQRNKLPTVSPETLNWLKDSDVTWLYGPLHTAEDDKPAKPPGIAPSTPSTADAAPRRTTKPILKYRSITELLTSDLPTSPVFSPPESETESSRPPSPPAVEPGTSAPSPGAIFKRPKLQHTKSDTHITRWPNRAYRKDSPPRIEPPGHTENDSYFPKVSATGAVRSSLSQDSNSSAGNSTERNGKKKHISFNTFVEQVIAIDKPKRSSSFYGAGERWDPSRRVFDDDDGYEEDQEDSGDEETILESSWSPRHTPGAGINRYQDIEEEMDDGIIEMRSSFRNATPKNNPRSQSKASNTSSSSASTASSTTTSSTSNSSPSPTRDSVALSSLSSAKRKPLTRRATSASYRSHLARGGPPEHVHVTIAPIAPTVLKTEVWEENFGDDGAGSDDGIVWREPLWNHAADGKGKGRAIRGRAKVEDDASDASGTPVELVYVPPFNGRYSYGFAGYEEDEEDEDEEGDEFEPRHGFDDDYLDADCISSLVQSPAGEGTPSAVYLHRETAAGSVGFEDYEATERHNHRYPAGSYHPSTYGTSIPIPVPDESEREHVDYIDPTHDDSAPSPVPKLVVDQSAQIRSVLEEDENDFFDADADYGNEYMQRSRAGSRGGYVSRNRRPMPTSGSSRVLKDVDDERPSRSTSRTTSERSRSKSHSRTPSPALASASTSSHFGRSGSASASPSSSHLQPPTRGRSQLDTSQGSLGRSYSSGSLQSENTRGRSTSRTSSNAPSMEGSTSPFAGSPDGSGSRIASAGSAYVGGGRMDRERRGREPTKERERGRDPRTSDKRLSSASVSASPDPPTPVKREASSATDVTDSTYSSSTSGSRTVMPEGAEEERIEVQPQQQQQQQEPPTQQQQPQEEKRGKKRMTAEDFQREAEDFLRRAHPTPSNSPILEMKAPYSLSTHQRTTSSSSSSRSGSGMETPTAQSVQAKAVPAARPPPTLIPSPSSPVQPSTSQYNAISPTLKGGATGQRSKPIVKGSQPSPTAGVSASPSPSSSSPSGSVGADTEGSGGELSMRTSTPPRAKERTTPVATESSIMGKAQEVAGAFLGWWNHA